MDDWVYISDNAYSKSQIIKMEREILLTLEFDVSPQTSYRFLQRFCKIAMADDRYFHLAQYLIELTLIEQCMLVYTPS